MVITNDEVHLNVKNSDTFFAAIAHSNCLMEDNE